MSGYMHVCAGSHEGQRLWVPPGAGLAGSCERVLMWMLETELQSLQQWHASSTWEAGTGGTL